MTKDRDFKKLVRERMARTGERYAAARAQLATREPPGLHPETAALARVLAHANIAGPHGPATEALLLGLGGGIGAACFTFEYKGHKASFYVATRCEPQYAYGVEFVQTAAERAGATCIVAESTSPAAAKKKLAAAAKPAIVWLDVASLPWSRKLGGAADLGAMPHVIVVDEIENDTAIVRDLPARPFAIGLAELATARKRLRVGKHRVLSVARGDAPDWPAVYRAAIAQCAAGLRGRTKIKGPMAKNFGIGGLRRWVAALTNPKDAKAWTRAFPPATAASGLAWTRHWIEHGGTGGGAFRPMYAEFLDGAAKVLAEPQLKTLAKEYRILGTAWSAFATSLLAPFDPIRKAQDTRFEAFTDGDLDAVRAAEAKVTSAIKTATIDAAALRAHYDKLGAELAAIVDAEESCAARLAAAVD
jgi:hypothetical protein